VGTVINAHRGAVTSAVYSWDGHLIVSGGRDTTLRVWNADSGRPIGGPMTGHTAAVTDVAFGPAGGRIVSRSDDHTLRLWEPRARRLLAPR
jgi:WD40 repeat protein